jgi:hypothetical protein
LTPPSRSSGAIAEEAIIQFTVEPWQPLEPSYRPVASMSDPAPRILYCHCQYAQVVPREVKEGVLQRLCESGVAFDAVADLCEMAARRDPALQHLAASGRIKIAACFPRAVKGLFHQTGADLPLESTEVLNMRTQSADEIAARLLGGELRPNLPGKVAGNGASEPAPSPPNEASRAF